MHEIGVRDVVTFAGMDFNILTLKMTWITMAVVFVIAILATRSLKMVPTGWQNALEVIIEWLNEQMGLALGPRSRFIAPLIITLFLFLLVSNWIGLIPTMSSPTSDLNTTLGLALIVVVYLHFLGVYFKGFKYFKHFFQPIAPFVILNIIEEVAKPVTLAFRLFGNILAGEIMIIILLKLIPMWMPIPSVLWLAFSLFIGAVQAFIFTMLAMSYIAGAIQEEH